ncbi:hypothetical protein F2P79_022245 [Pimephales promelas]|nr:hypothetical protein F2P79_022245 [Pimephales promelas]
MEVFSSVLLYAGVFEFPSLEDDRACESRFPPVAADTASVKRFEPLRRYVRFNDDFQLEGCPDRFQQRLLIPPTNRQSVDEVPAAYKGGTRAGKLGQCIQNEPDKWGFEIFCRGSDSGVLHDFISYRGSATVFDIQEEERAHPGSKDLLLGAEVVSILRNTIAVRKEATAVFYDNFFTSFNSVKTLRTNPGLRSVGTVRVNRAGGATLTSDKETVKRGRGFVDFRSSEGVVAAKRFCAWLVYKRDRRSILKQKPMPLKKSRLSVAATSKGADEVPAGVGRPPGAKRKPQVRRPNPRVLHPTQEVRRDGVGHRPAFGTRRGRCNLRKSGVSRWRRSKRGDGKLLYKNQRFVAYHQR